LHAVHRSFWTGKYAACRENAEAKLVTSGDATKYGETIAKYAGR